MCHTGVAHAAASNRFIDSQPARLSHSPVISALFDAVALVLAATGVLAAVLLPL